MSTSKYSQIALTALAPYPKNARTHSDEQVEKIAKSLQEFGFINPVLIDSKNMIIAGHGRVLAAKKIGMDKVPCVRIEGLTDEQIRAYILADNRLAEDAGWDDDILKAELQELKDNGFDISLTGFSIDDISFEDIDFSDIDEGIEELEEKAQEEPQAVMGTRYKLGDHILMVGDSTKPEDVKKLMGGISADLCVTDPPYNVALGWHMRPSEAKQLHRRKDGLVIENDSFEDESKFIDFLTKAFSNMRTVLKSGGVFYIWLSSTHMQSFLQALENSGLQMREFLIWVKNIFSFGRQDYQWRHEPCIYGWKDGAAHYFTDDRTKSTVWEKLTDIDALTETQAKDILRKFYSERETPTTTIHENKPVKSELHPTMKPVALIEKSIENSSKENEVVLDLFGGSGTTLIACENKHRRCFMMEYDQHYADVIIKRWEDLTGKKAEKLED